ncbi:hypothetical protein QEN19_000714 [Hanseniaspora menglaensis]
MSSIINKSNTRFKPKFNSRPNSRQQPPTTVTPAISLESPLNTFNEDSVDPLSKITANNDVPIQSTQLTQIAVIDNGNNVTENSTTQIAEIESKNEPLTSSSVLMSIKQRRASTRLGSISQGTLDNSVSRRPSFMQSRRPSLSNNQLQIVATPNRINDILQTKAAAKSTTWRTSVNKDSALMSMKRRRKSSAQLKSVKSKSVSRISSVNRLIDTSSSENSKNGSPEITADGNGVNVDNEQAKEDLYKIKNLKDIPRLIGEEESKLYTFDDSSFTMAELCKPTLPIGVVTANYAVSKEAARKKRMERERRKSLRKMARAQNKSLSELTKEEDNQQEAVRKKEQEALLSMDIPEPEAAGTADLQLKLDKDGNIIVDEESTVIDKHQQYSVLNRTKEVTQETNFTNLYNNASYTKQSYTDPWTVDEEIKFYKSLSKWGTDFNFISQLFPYRTRRQVKLKFSLEERKNPVLIELALKRKLPFDFEMFVKECTVANIDPTQPKTNATVTSINKLNIFTLEQYEERLQEVRNRHEESLQQIELGKEMAKSEDNRMVEEREREKENNKTKNKTVGAGGLTQDELGKRRAGEVVIGIVGQKKTEEF